LKKDHLAGALVRPRLIAPGEVKKRIWSFAGRPHYNDADVKEPDSLLLIGLAGCENVAGNSISTSSSLSSTKSTPMLED